MIHLPGYVAFNAAGHLPLALTQLRSAETTNSSSQLEAHLQAPLLEQHSENHIISGQSACQAADRDP